MEKKADLRRDVYSKACTLSKSDNVQSLENAADLFAQIPGYLDVDTRLEACETRLEELKSKLAREKARRESSDAAKTRIKWISIVLVIALVVGLAVGIPLAKAGAHDVKDIKIEIVNMKSEYDPDASPYINGLYYIYFDFEITNNTGTAIDYIDVIIHVSDKSGTELGTISTTFGGYYSSSMNLKKSEMQRFTTTVSESQPNNNSFFTSMYNTNVDEWTFTYEFDSVAFSDGEHYFAED